MEQWREHDVFLNSGMRKKEKGRKENMRWGQRKNTREKARCGGGIAK